MVLHRSVFEAVSVLHVAAGVLCLCKIASPVSAMAGEVRLMTTGASPISAEVMDFLRICFGATVIEGYGMTETACTICMTAPGDTSSGHVGGPLACCEVKLADIPEMSYTTADRPHPRGEVNHARMLLVVGSSFELLGKHLCVLLSGR